MHQSWLESTTNGSEKDIWAVDFTAHPFLDPEFPLKRTRFLDLARLTYGRIRKSNRSYRKMLDRLFHSPASPEADVETLTALATRAREYLLEADIYLASAIDLLPVASRQAVTPLCEVSSCDDVLELMAMSFQGSSGRLQYEARRKLFLAQTLLHIDQSRVIQDGPRHRSFFEHLLNEGLWCHTRQVHDLSIGFHVGANGSDINYTTRPSADERRIDFRSTFVEKVQGERTISLDVLYYNCRFKRAVAPISLEVVDGVERVQEKSRWGEMRTESGGSILSKMIRKGINNPDEIGDIIGAMFIVPDNEALNDLLILLESCLSTPFGWRNVTDTLSGKANGSSLNLFSSKEFKVLKGDVDILYEESGCTPYRFPVEIQIFTLEGYLRTVCGTHEASHLALKLRQFVFGLVPRIFPRQIYGSDWLKLDK
jgi:hypothetical protein